MSDTRHLSDQELMDALDGSTQPAFHLEACADCRSHLDAAREGLRLLAGVAEVPEPSPLYWEAFRRQLDRRLDKGRTARGWWRLEPMLAAAAVLVAIVGVLPLRPGAPSAVPASAPTWSALPATDEDGSLVLLEAWISSSEDLREAGVDALATGDLAGLSDDESRALTEALRGELGSVGEVRRDS